MSSLVGHLARKSTNSAPPLGGLGHIGPGSRLRDWGRGDPPLRSLTEFQTTHSTSATRATVRNQWPSMHVLPATQGMPGRLVNCRSTVNTFRRPISLNLRTCTILQSQKYQPIQMSWHSRWFFSISRPAISWSLRQPGDLSLAKLGKLAAGSGYDRAWEAAPAQCLAIQR